MDCHDQGSGSSASSQSAHTRTHARVCCRQHGQRYEAPFLLCPRPCTSETCPLGAAEGTTRDTSRTAHSVWHCLRCKSMCPETPRPEKENDHQDRPQALADLQGGSSPCFLSLMPRVESLVKSQRAESVTHSSTCWKMPLKPRSPCWRPPLPHVLWDRRCLLRRNALDSSTLLWHGVLCPQGLAKKKTQP